MRTRKGTSLPLQVGAIGGKGFVTISGDLSAVTEAVQAAKAGSELLVESAVIAKPTEQLYEALM